MSDTKRAALFAAVILNIVFILIVMTSAGGQCRGTYPVRLNDIPSPEGTVEQFFRCIRQNDLDGADALIANYRTLGFDEAEAVSGSDALSVYISEHLTDSYAIEAVDAAIYSPSPSDMPVTPSDVWMNSVVIDAEDYTISGGNAVTKVRYTCLDSSKLTERLAVLSGQLGKQLAESGVAVDNDQAAMELFDKAVDSLAADDCRKYYSTITLDIELSYIDGGWRIVVTPELYDALCGKLNDSSVAEAAVSSSELNGGVVNE